MSSIQAKKILIVEDEAALLSALQAQLHIDGFTVKGASDGELALKILKSFKPDLIVLDILLPKIDGWEVLHRLRADVQHVNTPVIIITNLTDKKTREKAQDLSVKDFITKADFDLDEIIAKIKDALND